MDAKAGRSEGYKRDEWHLSMRLYYVTLTIRIIMFSPPYLHLVSSWME